MRLLLPLLVPALLAAAPAVIPAYGYGIPSHGIITAADTVPNAATPIRAGDVLRGELTAADPQDSTLNRHLDRWSFQGRAGETVTFLMEGDTFDPEVRVGRWREGEWEPLGTPVATDASLTSVVNVTFPEDGEYEIQARARFPGSLGPYTLSVRSP